jgi:hypothetical protein
MTPQRWCFNFSSLLLFFSVSAQALPLNPEIQNSSAHQNAHENWGCSFEGNSDLYGLGIRLGVYLQLLSTLLANGFLSNELREDARNTNAIIMIAVFAGMASATINNQTNGIEIFVMTTLLISFLWSDFTPSHISALLFEQTEKEPPKDRKTWRLNIPAESEIASTSSSMQKDGDAGGDTEELEVENKPYFAAISRSVFGTAIALFNAWYWLHSRHTLLKNNIDDPLCIPIVFLETQIALGTNQALFYVITSVIYAVYEVLFMCWWIFILAPGILRLLYELLMIGLASVCRCKRARTEMTVNQKIAKWYLSFARLDAGTLRVFSSFRISKQNQARLRNMRAYVRLGIIHVFLILREVVLFVDGHNLAKWMGLPVGYMVIMWASIAIELTLAWNGVSGIYVLGSTGQLIPFVVGVLGLVRNLHLIAVKLSERTHERKEERSIRVEWETGAYVYGEGERELKLEVKRPKRRWSIDSGLVDLGNEKDSMSVSREMSFGRTCSWKTD